MQFKPRYICACKENFIGDTCHRCNIGFYGEDCFPCPRNPVDHTVCGTGGVCDDGIDGTGKCVCVDQNNDPAIFCQGVVDREKQKDQEEDFTFGLILLILVAFLTTFVCYIYHRVPALHSFPESITAILVGIVLGILFKAFYNKHTEMLNIVSFEPHTFFLFLLPCIMYEAGFSLKVKVFLKNIVPVMGFAVFSTIIAAFLFSVTFYYFSSFTDYPISMMASSSFGSFISAIDPVATIAIFKSLGVAELPFTMVLGEAVLNDAVAIALANSIDDLDTSMREGENILISEAVLKGLIYFFWLLTFSVLLGFLCGLLFSYLFKKL